MVKKVILTMILIQIMFVPISNAFSLDSIISTGDSFIEEGKASASAGELINEDQLNTTVGDLYNILFGIGVALSVLIGAALGIKFMVGSVEEQAKIKEALIPYVIGGIVVFGAFGIWKVINTMGGNIFG